MKALSRCLMSLLIWSYLAATVLLSFLVILLIFPFALLWDPNRIWSHRVGVAWGRFLLGYSPVWRITILGKENLDPRAVYLFVSTHQSLGDILAAFFIDHPFKFVAKRELFRIPVFGTAMSLSGYIPLNRGDRESGRECLERARRYLRSGISVLFFPEGTRSRDGTVQPFKTGAFRLAVEERVSVVPIVILGTREILCKGSWVFNSKSHVVLSFGRPIPTKNLDYETIPYLRDEVREEMSARRQQLHAQV